MTRDPCCSQEAARNRIGCSIQYNCMARYTCSMRASDWTYVRIRPDSRPLHAQEREDHEDLTRVAGATLLENAELVAELKHLEKEIKENETGAKVNTPTDDLYMM